MTDKYIFPVNSDLSYCFNSVKCVTITKMRPNKIRYLQGFL